MELKGSKTEKNLWEAFAGESQARNKYNFYASKAKKDGYEEIARVFEETANNEKEHAKIWFKALYNGVPGTLENLIDAAAGERSEWTDMYARMAREAKEEGFDDLAYKFEAIAAIEKFHEERFLQLAESVKAGKVFTRKKSVSWFCLNCGHIHEGKEAIEMCPVCDHPKSYFIELK